MTDTPAPRMTLLADGEFDDEQAVLAESYRRNGSIINVVRLFARFTAFFRAYKPFGLYTMVRSPLPPRLRELAILRVAVINRSGYEWAHHSRIGHACGLTLDEIERVRVSDDGGWSADDLALLQTVDALRRNADLSDEEFDRARRILDEAQLFDLIVTVGNYSMVSTALNVARVPIEPGLTDLTVPFAPAVAG